MSQREDRHRNMTERLRFPTSTRSLPRRGSGSSWLALVRWKTRSFLPAIVCFPGGDCRLKNPTEVHLTFSVWPWPGDETTRRHDQESLSLDRFHVEPVPGEQGYKVHVEWLSSYHSSRFNGPQATLGGIRESWLHGEPTDWWSDA